MRILGWILIFSTVFTITANGQEGDYLYGPNSKMVQTKIEAVVHKEVKKKSNNRYRIKTFIKRGNNWNLVKTERIAIRGNSMQKITYNAGTFFPRRFKREITKISNGMYNFEESNRNGKLRTGTSSAFLPLHLEDTVTQYFKNGRIKSISRYHDNQLITNQNWLKDGSKYIDSIFYSVDKEPTYQMDKDFFKNYMISKIIEAKINLDEIDDDVIIGLVIMETGKIKGVHALQGRSLEFNAFLESAIANLPGEWTPAMLNGSPVRYFMTIPLNFRHNNAYFQNVELSSGILYYNQY